MEGSASLTGNITEYTSGGGVLVNGGTFIMQDSASIKGNTVSNWNVHDGDLPGGGVHVHSGNFIMQGGEISGNISGGRGGGIYVGSDGTFIMESGTISGNTTNGGSLYSGYGGGVAVDGIFTMQGGTISGNTAKQDGGGVYLRNGKFSMQGGTIMTGNNTSQNGGGVYITGGTFIKTGGTIHGNDEAFSDRNNASKQGHALFWNSNPTRWRNATAGPDDNTGGYGFWMND